MRTKTKVKIFICSYFYFYDSCINIYYPCLIKKTKTKPKFNQSMYIGLPATESNIVCHTGIIGSNQLLTALIVARPGWIHIGKLPLHIVNGTRCVPVRVHLDSKTTASWSEENKFKYSEWFQLLSIFAYSYQNHQKMLSYLWQVEIPLLHRLVILFFFFTFICAALFMRSCKLLTFD